MCNKDIRDKVENTEKHFNNNCCTESAVSDHNLSSVNSNKVFLQTLIVNVVNGDFAKQVRVLLDSGSQRSYIKRDLALEMKYKVNGSEEIMHSLFGGIKSKPHRHNSYKIRLRSLNNKYACNFDTLDQDVICDSVPTLQYSYWFDECKRKGIDVVNDSNGPIDVLIGSDVYGKLMSGKCEILDCGLVAMETHLGWILTGKLNSLKQDNSMSAVSMHILYSENVSNLWELDILGIRDPIERKSKEEETKAVYDHFFENVCINDDGRYEVKLPWIEGHRPVPRNFEQSKKRLENVVYKLKKTYSFDKYDEVFNDWMVENIIEEIPIAELDNGHYLPHRPIFKENSTTKVRPVFDASSKEKGNPSLNECLHKGVNLLEIIPKLLLRFRKNKIGVIADIRKAFLQISLNEDDRDFLRFLWMDKNGQMKIFRHSRVVFGVTSSPFLLSAVIDYHLKRCLEESNIKKSFSKETIEKLSRGFYVDNLVISLQERDDVQQFIREAVTIFANGKFDLRGWEYSDPLLKKPTNTSLLGLTWDKKNDTLSISSNCWALSDIQIITRRTMLSVAQKIFDPIGFTCPITLLVKLLLQKSWLMKGGWDDEVPEEIKLEFLNWYKQLPLLKDLFIPRWLKCMEVNVTSHTIHTFCDASKDAYACAVFVRTEYESGQVNVQLIQAKSRVTPLKKMTIPRLELMAATIGARLINGIKEELYVEDHDIYFWSDSSVVIAWIRREEQWNVFVANRIKEIRSLTNRESWRHLPGINNPADLPSRGCNIKQLIEYKWWEGPQWLKLSKENWPIEEFQTEESMVHAEKRKITTYSLHNSSNTPNWYYSKVTTFQNTVRIIGWIYRFINNCRSKVEKNNMPDLTFLEIQKSEKCVLKLVQTESFKGIEDECLKSLRPFFDEEGLIRIQTKLTERKDTFDFRHPIVLPSKHQLVEIMIMDKHKACCHIGVQGMLCMLREQFWILQGRKTVKNILFKCTICRRHDAKSFETIIPPLPETRVRDAAVFEVTGIDFCGPVYLKDNIKVWICLFTCAVYRAVHLEVCSSLSSNAFIQVLRRFIARRGRPTVIYTDNGTNFTGTENVMSKVDWEQICKYSSVEKIEWRFNPPLAAWWGGWWERLIKILKQLFRKTVGRALLKYDELETVLCDCEAQMNSRPLTYVTENAGDLLPITPNMFLHDIKEVGVPDLDNIDSKNISKRLKYIQKIRNDMRKRFRIDYLSNLILLSKRKTRRIRKNEIVLIGNNNFKRIDWPLAVVQEVIMGRDGEIRMVKLRTSNGIVTRPIQLIYPLEIFQEADTLEDKKEEINKHDSDNLQKNSYIEVKTRCGRKVKFPKRYIEDQ